jgi:hypothetical protein
MRELPPGRLLLSACLAALATAPVPRVQAFSCLGEKLDTPACSALGQLYDSTGGDWSWKETAGWSLAARDEAADACAFFGVTCAGGEIERLNLFNNGLRYFARA